VITRLVVRVLLITCGLCAAATSAFAQTGFVYAGTGIEVRRFSGEESDRVFDATSRQVVLGFGGFLMPHITAAVELDLGTESTASRSTSITLGGRPTTVTTTYAMRRRTVSALVGVSTSPARRISIAACAGLSFNSVRRETGSDAPPIVLSTPSEPVVFIDRTVSPVVGVDAVFQVASHVAIAAMVRGQGITLTGDLRGIDVRPSAVVRVVF
jgi:hypothetical protein